MTRVVEREDVGVLEAREKSDLADESKLTGFRSRIGVQNLERNSSVVPRVAGEIDGCEGALANLALDFVAAGKGGTEWRKGILRDGRSSHSLVHPGVRSANLRIEHEGLADLKAALTQAKASQT
jgi:hypothetical protein